MVHFIQRYSNTNIILINIPYRHDLRKNDKRNCTIQAYNNKLKNISSIFNHVTLIETSLDWRFFTRHGFHLNKVGKDWLTKQIVGQIKQLVQISKKDNHVLNLKGKVEVEKNNENDAAIPANWNNNPLTSVNGIEANDEAEGPTPYQVEGNHGLREVTLVEGEGRATASTPQKTLIKKLEIYVMITVNLLPSTKMCRPVWKMKQQRKKKI
jgi:hypothetical protein